MVFGINFYRESQQMSPPNKRDQGHLAWYDSLLYPLQWLFDLFFTQYAQGFTGPKWSAISFNKGDRVRYIDRGVYEALQNVTGADVPGTSANWLKVSDLWIGANERVLYDGRKLALEYALNKWFDNGSFSPTFRQPPLVSDIFITNNIVVVNQLKIGVSDIGDAIGIDESFTTNGIPIQEIADNPIAFGVNVPVALWTSLGSTSTDRDNVIRSIVDKYVIAGIKYNVLTY